MIFLWIETGNFTNNTEQRKGNVTCARTRQCIFSLDIYLIQIAFSRKITAINRSVVWIILKKKKEEFENLKH